MWILSTHPAEGGHLRHVPNELYRPADKNIRFPTEASAMLQVSCVTEVRGPRGFCLPSGQLLENFDGTDRRLGRFERCHTSALLNTLSSSHSDPIRRNISRAVEQKLVASSFLRWDGSKGETFPP